MLLYGVRSPGPGSDIVGDVVEWFETRAEAERFIAEVAGEPNPDTRCSPTRSASSRSICTGRARLNLRSPDPDSSPMLASQAILKRSAGGPTRFPASLVILLLAVIAALLTGAASVVLRESAEKALEAKSLVGEVAREANRLEALEWQAKAEQDVSVEVSRDFREARRAIARLLPHFRHDPPGVVFADTYAAYMTAVEEVFRLISSGELARARAFDEERVDPAFERLEELIADEIEEHAEIAGSKNALAEVTSSLALSFAGLVIGLLFWQVREQRKVARREREQAERLREQDRLKDSFVASVSHELRTPLTSIRGYLELVLEEGAGELSDEQRAHLAIVERNAVRLQRVVGDLMFVAQVDAGKLAIERAPVDLAALAADCVEASRPFALEKGVALSLSAESGPELSADAARLGQMLDNLVSNALKFTPAGGRVEVRTSASDGRALLEVADTGSGISAADVKRVFERFFRSASANEQAVQGTGLGLGITKAIVEAHGGTIGVESELGAGTTVRVELPVAGRADVETPLEPMEVA